MKHQSVPFMRISIVFSLLFFAVLTLTSCQEVLDEITFTVTITNNSSEDLEMWLQVDGSAFEKSTDLTAGQSTAGSFYVADVEYVYEARKDDGTVYATRTFKQSNTTDQTWDIN